MRQARDGPCLQRGNTTSSLWLRTTVVRRYIHLRVIPTAEPGGTPHPGGKHWCGAGAVGTVGLWPSTGRCSPPSQPPSWPNRCRGSSRSSKNSPGATGSSRVARSTFSPRACLRRSCWWSCFPRFVRTRARHPELGCRPSCCLLSRRRPRRPVCVRCARPVGRPGDRHNPDRGAQR